MRIFNWLIIVISLTLLQSCAKKQYSYENNEIVMKEGMKITVINDTGTLVITAESNLERSFTWEGATRSVIMWPRTERWDGSLGLYYPGPGNHWKEHNRITRAVVREGYKHFQSIDEALDWLNLGRIAENMVYTDDGLAVGWIKSIMPTSGPGALAVDIWQIYINGVKPKSLPGSHNDQIIVGKGH